MPGPASGSLLVTHRLPVYTPSARLVELKVTVTSVSVPPALEPAVALNDSHGMSAKAVQATGVTSASPVTFMTMCIPGKPSAAVSVGSVTPQPAAAR